MNSINKYSIVLRQPYKVSSGKIIFSLLEMFCLLFVIKCMLCLVNITSSATTSTTIKVSSSKGHQPNIKTNVPTAQKILNDLSWPLKLALMKKNLNASKEICSSKICKTADTDNTRRVGVQALLKAGRREDLVETTPDPESDDTNMKMKLFRLMYETVRDSDLKVKRAELIKKSYTNSSSFEVGYLLGDVTDKFNIMTDISLTLKRLYHEWKPIEHINAYEQVANLAIDIGHIIDMIKGLEKKISSEEGDHHKKKGQNLEGNSSDPGYFQIQ